MKNPFKAVRDYIVGDHHLIPLQYEPLNLTAVELPKREDTGPTPAPTKEQLAADPLYKSLGIVQNITAFAMGFAVTILIMQYIL